jgi:hypothetical protein
LKNVKRNRFISLFLSTTLVISTPIVTSSSDSSFLSKANAATVSTSTIDCEATANGTSITLSATIVVGDILTINVDKCQRFRITWSATYFNTIAGQSAGQSGQFGSNGPDSESITAAAAVPSSGTIASIECLVAESGGGSGCGTVKKINLVQPSAEAGATWSAKSPGAGVVGTSYSYTFNTSSGTGNITLKSGSLPTGLTLSTGGVLSGTPTNLGTYTFTLQRAEVTADTGSVSIAITGPVVTKVTICHRTSATTNPYRMITVSVNSIISSSGHSEHNTTRTNKVNPQDNTTNGSGVFNPSFSYPSNRKWWGDIIPPFTHSGGNYAGLNWGGRGNNSKSHNH